MDFSKKPPTKGLIVIAAVITLVVTMIRFAGEWKGWDPRLFNPEPGASAFGITWLVPIFGVMFGRRLAKGGAKPPFVKSFFVPMFAALGLMFAMLFCLQNLKDESLLEKLQYVYYAGPLVALLGLLVWPRAFVTCLIYGVLARVPVLVLQYLAIQNGWSQTHYGKVPPGLPTGADDRLWMLTLAQGGFWIPFTVLLGGGMAALGAATVRKA
ncbi:MAG TPA: hypothetical protein VF384_19015 [Planctomycetota bacterium]